MAGVTLENLCKIYPGEKGSDITAVSNLNLEIKDREFVVFVGPSGCGKSTALRMIAGLEQISKGNVIIGGKRVNHLPAKDRDIAMVFQNFALYPHMTVYDNMAFGLKLRKYSRSEIRKRVEEAAAILGIENLLKRKPKALSGGQRQRVAVGRAIVRQPKVFLFDEPLSNLDAKLRVQMRSEITKLHQRLQATMIYVTHDQTEAMSMGERIVVMKDGMVQQIDEPLTLYDEPANLFVAGFLGSPSMNFLRGKLKDAPQGVLFKEEGGGTINCPITHIPGLKSYVGKEVVLGIRPENISYVAGPSKQQGYRFQALVDFVEPMGAETYFYLQTGGHMVICRSQASVDHHEADGHRMQFEVDSDTLKVFDAETTNRII
jgi:multiple sugar transport system ATP-binding protein